MNDCYTDTGHYNMNVSHGFIRTYQQTERIDDMKNKQ